MFCGKQVSRIKARLFVPGLLVGLALAIILAGCGGSTSPTASVRPVATVAASMPVVAITAVDYGYVMSDTIAVRSGLVDFALVNNGTQAHQAQIARLNKGVTREQVLNEFIAKQDQAAAFSLLTLVGGPDIISPGYGQEAMLDFPAGEYVLLCLVVGSDGVSHVDKGMIHFFTVAVGQGQGDQPQADGVIALKDTGYGVSPVITQARALTLQVTNQGNVAHEMNIVKLAAGKGVRDIVAFFQAPSGPPPFEELGGMAALAPGAAGWIKTRLDAGNYAMFSFIPDPRSGKPQLSEGVISPFTVG